MWDWITCSLVAGGFAPYYVISRRRRRRDLSQYLIPDLQKCGMTLLSSTYPVSFKVGPFPKFEVEFGRPFSEVCGIQGEYSSFRIVRFQDPDGRAYELWAKVEFELFKLRRVRWRATLKESLPASVLPILEN